MLQLILGVFLTGVLEKLDKLSDFRQSIIIITVKDYSFMYLFTPVESHVTDDLLTA